MATPMTAAQFAQALRDEGLIVVEVGDWETHNRNHKGPWGPVHGALLHHTVTSGSARTVAICRDGYTDLPGPLCHGVITKDGRVHLVGYGRTNHAGLGDGDVLRAVIAERPLPADNETDTDGNRHFYGFECENLGDGEDPWPAVQVDAMVRASAAVCRHHGWGQAEDSAGTSTIGHLEWQPGKSDPRPAPGGADVAMPTLRGRITERLRHPASWNPTQEEDDMALTNADVDKIVKALMAPSNLKAIAAAVLQTDGLAAAPDGNPKGNNAHWRLGSLVVDDNKRGRRIEAAIGELVAQGAARDAVLASLAKGGGLTAAEARAAAEAGAQAALDRLAAALDTGSGQ